ncbi:putative pre-rRNA processing protein Mrd1 [Aspergillus taichungensis]|uniref:Multiple RNA-binding domain-containing protein 1 n=1 Tax=Aspergillus taichungensis TaxID=482145 RepID=A0A2J5HMJ3_9EURO|nr:putative pre-rRNA processing protein Mrd1 [Aspergillus taichungensis]
MESTRVFVSGLPPTFSNDQLRKHFATRFQVTDAHVLPKRRIGFVGFKSHDDARQAVGYFNKTYMKMSKISVDIAKPIDSEPDHTHNRAKESRSSDATDTLKRKRGGEDAPKDPKLQEYLSVMQHSSKTQTWANDDNAPNPSEEHSPEKDQPEEDTQDLTFAQRKKAKFGEAEDRTPLRNQEQGEPEPMVVDATGEAHDEQQTEQQNDEEKAPVSDADWLRSKTSRLLGLLDEDEQAEFESREPPKPAVQEAVSDSEEDAMRVENVTVKADDKPATPATPEIEVDTNIENIRLSARLFVRNLAYDTTESTLGSLFAPFGTIEEIHVAFDTRVSKSKGFAYVQFIDPESAVEAYRNLDGKQFEGRLLHILPASAKKTYKIDEHELSKLPLKKQKQIKRKLDASSASFSWNSLYMNADAVMSSVAERIGVSKSDLLDPTSADAAVKQAHAETHVIQETKAYFTANGVNIDAFKQRERGNTAILVKNFSFGVKSDEIRKLFEPFGQITRLLMPPSGTIAIVELSRPDEAQKAFKGLVYRKVGDSILFLEKAPKNLFDGTTTPYKPAETKAVSQGFSTADTFTANEPDEALATAATATLFVKNLAFTTTNEAFLDVFRPLDGFISGRIKTKPDPKHPGQTLSMGFGFVDFKSKQQAQSALGAMNGYRLDGHELVVRASHKGMDAAEERRREDTAKKVAARRTKIIIKNLPFQATKKDIRSLFGAYGQLRSVRVPQKFDRSARGFGFADFVSAREAENAMDALKDTHLLGRRLVLEFANVEAIDAEEEIRQIEKKVGEQLDRVKLQKLTGTGRKKFTVGAQDEED